MTEAGDIRLTAIRAGGRVPRGEGGEDLVAAPSVASVRAYPDLDALDAAMEADPRVYRRHGNETVAMLEGLVATLESPPGAAEPVARVTASGQAALALVVSAAAMSGRRRVVLVRPCYGGTDALLRGPLAALGVTTTTVDLPPPPQTADVGALVDAVMGPDVALVVAEVITNPLLGVVDIPAAAAAAHAAGAMLVVDSTLATPFLFQGLAHGADAVLHSLTKHLAGHSDVLGGAAIAAAGSEIAGWLDGHSRTLGAVLGPFDAWLTIRGLRTAPLRVERGTATAAWLAGALVGHPAVAAVHHPGVRGGADGALAARLLPGGGGPMLSLEVRGGLAGAGRVVRALDGIRLAPSLGDVSTTVSHPTTTSHRGIGAEELAALGITGGLLRFSVGIEDRDVLLRELTVALDAAG